MKLWAIWVPVFIFLSENILNTNLYKLGKNWEIFIPIKCKNPFHKTNTDLCSSMILWQRNVDAFLESSPRKYNWSKIKVSPGKYNRSKIKRRVGKNECFLSFFISSQYKILYKSEEIAKIVKLRIDKWYKVL
jgi:hypothetical protein